MARRFGKPTVIGLRSLAFHLASGVVTVVFLLLFPAILGPRSFVWWIMQRYISVQLWLLRVICGLRYQVIGAENVPDGACILASQHESMWETMFLPVIFHNPAVMLKQEILSYPFAGRTARKLEYIGVDRSGTPGKARKAFEDARRQAAGGRSILIFPNGTRDPQHRYRVQKGVSVLYRALKVPCVPILLNSGDYWIYHRWLRRPGVITIRILPPIPTGLRTSEFQARLENDLAQSA